MSLRICLVADRYPPAAGGTERHVEHLARRLSEQGHLVHVVALPHAGEPPVVERDGVTIHRLDGWRRLLGPLTVTTDGAFHAPAPDPGVIRALHGLFEQLGFDLVHAHGWIAFSAVGAARRCGIPVVVSVHDHGLVCARRTLLDSSGAVCSGGSVAKCLSCVSSTSSPTVAAGIALGLRLTRSVLAGADAIVANSAATASVLRDTALGRVPVVVASPYLGAVGSDPSAPMVSPPRVRPYLLYAGGTAPHKGLDVLLGAWHRVTGQFDLVVAGPGTAGWVPRAPLGSRVDPVGQLPDQQLRALMAGALATIVPSVWPEAFGLVVAESFSVGRPVIASDIGALRELVDHERTGLLVPPGRRGPLAEAIQRLVDAPGLADRLGREAATRVDLLDGFDTLEQTYRKVLALRRPGSWSSGDGHTARRAWARSSG